MRRGRMCPGWVRGCLTDAKQALQRSRCGAECAGRRRGSASWRAHRAGAKEAAEKGRTKCKSQKKAPQGLKPGTHFAAIAARLKSCPLTFRRAAGVFPQPVKPRVLLRVYRHATHALRGFPGRALIQNIGAMRRFGLVRIVRFAGCAGRRSTCGAGEVAAFAAVL